jgi:hypothetical protein
VGRRSRLPVAEADQAAVTAIAQYRREAGAVFVVEDMEHSAVDDDVEHQPEVS